LNPSDVIGPSANTLLTNQNLDKKNLDPRVYIVQQLFPTYDKELEDNIEEEYLVYIS